MHAAACIPAVTDAWQYEGGGAFFNNKGVAIKSSKVTYDAATAARLWKVSSELTHLDAN